MKNYKNLLIYSLVFITFFAYYLYCTISWGEFWSYSFVYNIASGYIPYKDFNMIITPLYPLLLGLICKIIGSNFYIFIMLNSLISTFIIKQIKDRKEDILIAILMLLVIREPGYNIFLLLLYYLIVRYKDSKYLLGILLAIMFLTKQNIGIILFIVMLLSSKDKLNNSLFFCIPITIGIIYLLVTSSLSYFIDQTILGLFNFTENNLKISFLVIFSLLILIHISYMFKKSKDKELLYIAGFLGLAFPIFDVQHFLISILPYVCFILPKTKSLYKYIAHGSLLLLVVSLISFNGYIPNNTKTLKYLSISSYFENNVLSVDRDIKDNSNKNIYIISGLTPLYKIESNIEPTRYDLVNYDNLGYKGTEKYIKLLDNTCSKEKCHFIITSTHWQTDKKLLNYVYNNYELIKEMNGIYIYEN